MASVIDRKRGGAFRVLCFYSVILHAVIQRCKGEQVTALSGQDVTLHCYTPINTTIVLLEWSRPDLERYGYVFFFSGNDLLKDFQHVSYRGRVEPRDPRMNGRDGSVTLRKVDVNDSGTFECLVLFRSSENEQIFGTVQRVVELEVNHDGVVSYSKNEEKASNGGAVKDEGKDGANELDDFKEKGESMNVTEGQDVTLSCHSPVDTTIELLEWSRLDLDRDCFIFFYREPMIHIDRQHPWFKGRVLPVDPSMKNGDGSVILRNINLNDTGTYVCMIGHRASSRRSRRTAALQSVITLTVQDSAKQAPVEKQAPGEKHAPGEKQAPGEKHAPGEKQAPGETPVHHALIPGVVISASVIVVAVAVGVLFYKKKCKRDATPGI